MQKVKIIYLIETLRPGGAEGLLFTTLKFIDRNEFEPLVYCIFENGEIGEKIAKLGIDTRSLNKKMNLTSLSAIFDLARIFKKENPGIVHTHLFFANIYGRIAAKLAGVRTIISTLHNPDYSFEDNGSLFFKLRKAVDKYSGRLCNSAFIAVSNHVKDDFQKLLGFKNILVLHNCIEASRFRESEPDLSSKTRKELHLSKDDIVLLNIGRLHPQKGHLFLIEAFALLRKYDPRFKLVIVGSGFLEGRLKQKTFELGVAENIIFLSNRSDIPQLLNSSDIFVFPSLYEGFGIALVEAMASGLAVVASDIEALREIISHGENGILSEPCNPRLLAGTIYSLIQDEQLRKTLGENARRKTLRLFDAGVYIRNLQDFYRKLMHHESQYA